MEEVVGYIQGLLDGSLYVKVKKKDFLYGSIGVVNVICFILLVIFNYVEYMFLVSSDLGNFMVFIKIDKIDEFVFGVFSVFQVVFVVLSFQEKWELDCLLSGFGLE